MLAQTTNNAPQAAPLPADGPQTRPWMNRPLDTDPRTELVPKERVLDEKLQLTRGYSSAKADWQHAPIKNYQPPNDRLSDSASLGIPGQCQPNAGLGIATQRSRTSLPSGIATVATWNPEAA